MVEIQEIRGITEQVEGMGTIHSLFKQPFDTPGESPDMWYQVSIMSPAVDAILRTNDELEFGNVTEMRLDDLAKTVVADLCRPACEVARNIDGVGFYNNNNNNRALASTGAPSDDTFCDLNDTEYSAYASYNR